MRHVTMTVNVTHVTALKVRVWFGLALIRLAARVIGCGVEVVA